MLIKPYAWSVVKPSLKTLKRFSNAHARPSIQIFGTTHQYESVYVRVYMPQIFIIHLKSELHPRIDEVIRFLDARYRPLRVEASVYTATALTLLFDNDVDIDLESDRDIQELIDEPVYFRDDYIDWFLSQSRIQPYNWIQIDDADIQPLPAAATYTTCDHELMVDFDKLSYPKEPVVPSLVDEIPIIYWDIESNSSTGNFTEAKTPDDFVTSISALVSYKGDLRGYVFIAIGPVDRSQLKKYEIPMEVIQCQDETDLLNKFYDFLSVFKPGIKIGYNDIFYDTPYLIDRGQLLGLAPPSGLSHIKRFKTRSVHIDYPSPLPNAVLEHAKEYSIPDQENLDMVLYFRRYYPGLPNYKLETVSQQFLNVGKTGLAYEELFRIIRERDPEGILRLIDYSFIDSILLGQLEYKVGVIGHLANLANDTGILRQDLLRLSDEKLIQNIFTNMDFGYYFSDFKLESALHFEPLKPGIYQNLKSYDYKGVILKAFDMAFKESGNKWLGIFALKFGELPVTLLNKILYCSYVPVVVRKYFRQLLEEQKQGLVGIDKNRAYYIGYQPPSPDYKLDTEYEYVFATDTEASVRIPLDAKGLQRYGKCNICRPEFPYMAEVFDDYVKTLRAGGDPRGKIITNINDLTVDKLVITGKIKPVTSFKGKTSWPARLAAAADAAGFKVTSWMTIPYIRVYHNADLAKTRDIRRRKPEPTFYPENSDPYLLPEPEAILKSPPIDVSYYISKVNGLLTMLDGLTLYT